MHKDKFVVQAIPLFGDENATYAQVTDEWQDVETIVGKAPTTITPATLEELRALGVILQKWEREGDKVFYRRSTTIVGIAGE
jgi:hypothetical protein